MIVAFSTSCSLVSVALLTPDGELIASGEEEAPMAASGACLRILQRLLNESKSDLRDATAFLSDLGPGSFTGVRVGVTLAKTLAFAHNANAGGANSFDLIDPSQTVVLPSKRGEWFIREPGCEPIRSNALPAQPFIGFGPGIEDPLYPNAARFASLLTNIEMVEPELLVPEYLIDPAISQPKKPFKT